MNNILSSLTRDYPSISFVKGAEFKWSPAVSQITYTALNTTESVWRLMHELGHALLGHKSFKSDAKLLSMERDAWNLGAEVAKRYQIEIDPDYIEDCLDTYRSWCYERSKCNSCYAQSVQPNTDSFLCLNCGKVWRSS